MVPVWWGIPTMPTMSPVEEEKQWWWRRTRRRRREGGGGNGGGGGEKEDEEKKNVPNEMAGGYMRGRRCGDSNNS